MMDPGSCTSLDDSKFWEYIPELQEFTPSFQLQREERRSLVDSTCRVQDLWRNVSSQREYIVRCFTLSLNAVHVIQTELNDLETDMAKSNISAVISADAVANRLKRSNQRPTPDQVSILKTLLAQKNSELAKIESDMLRLQLKINDDIGAMQELERLKAKKQAEANSCESWLVSARLLPSEVLTRIFQYSIDYRGPSMRRTSPFSLSQVCSTWRSSALGCSRFWNDLELDWSHFPTDRKPTGSLLDLWYSRANRHCPLSLSLKVDKYTNEDLVINFASHIAKFSSRMTTFSVELRRGPGSLAAFLVSAGGSFSNLESLTIIESDFTTEASPITIFGHSPRLHKVKLRIPPNMFEGDSRLFLPWNRLTHLHVGGLLMQSFAIILFQCTQLQVASFDDINLADRSNTWMPRLPPSPVVFPHLTDLRLRLNGPFLSHDISFVLEKMLIPSINKLDFAGWAFSFSSSERDLFPIDSILPPLNMSPLIRHLKLTYVDIDLPELLETLEVLLLLESLTICLDSLDIDSISLLEKLRNRSSGQSNRAPSLSHLTSFTFAYIIHSDEDDDEFDHVAFSKAFIALITSWITDSKRHRPLREISLLVCHDDLNKQDRMSSNEDMTEIFEEIHGTIQKNLAGVLNDSVFTATPVGDYDELLSILGFEKRRISRYPY